MNFCIRKIKKQRLNRKIYTRKLGEIMKLINKVKISLFILFFIILLLNTKAFAVTGVITEITVNVREKASTNSKRVMYVTQDDQVEVLKKEGQWYQIKYKNKTGYVFEQYIKVDDTKLNATQDSEPQTSDSRRRTTTRGIERY